MRGLKSGPNFKQHDGMTKHDHLGRDGTQQMQEQLGFVVRSNGALWFGTSATGTRSVTERHSTGTINTSWLPARKTNVSGTE